MNQYQQWLNGNVCCNNPVKLCDCNDDEKCNCYNILLELSLLKSKDEALQKQIDNIYKDFAKSKAILHFNDGNDVIINCNGERTLAASELEAYTAATSAIMGECIDAIGTAAFVTFNNLTAITITDSVTKIYMDAFANCSGLTSIDIPDSVDLIGNEAFYGCSSLSSVTLSENITGVPYRGFGFCTSLASIEIPDSVTSIGNQAFTHCSGLTSVTLSDNITSIGQNAFYGCSGLTSIDIPATITVIMPNAFYGCSSLMAFTCNAVTPPTLITTALFNTNNCPIYVPAESVDAYKSASGWSDYAARIQANQ